MFRSLGMILSLLLIPACKGSLEPGGGGASDSDTASGTDSGSSATTTTTTDSASATSTAGGETGSASGPTTDGTSGATSGTSSGAATTSGDSTTSGPGTSGSTTSGSTSGVSATSGGSTSGSTGPDLPADCELVPEAGGCLAMHYRYYFNTQTNRCDSFVWGGCDGVVPFETFADCLGTCPDPRPLGCSEEGDPGGCAAAFERWEYNPVTEQCESFVWGGCDGHVPFSDEAACEAVCE